MSALMAQAALVLAAGVAAPAWAEVSRRLYRGRHRG